jgi:hypothetical protein
MTCPAKGKKQKRKLTGSALRQSELIGIWKDRDLPDSSEFARQLRYRNQYRPRTSQEGSQGKGLAGKNFLRRLRKPLQIHQKSPSNSSANAE